MKHSYAEKQVDVDYLIEQNLELVRKIAGKFMEEQEILLIFKILYKSDIQD